MVQDATTSTKDTQAGAVTKGRGLPDGYYEHDPGSFNRKERKVEPKQIPSCSILHL